MTGLCGWIGGRNPGASIATFRVGNKQVVRTGRYALLAGNSVGSLSATPGHLLGGEAEG